MPQDYIAVLVPASGQMASSFPPFPQFSISDFSLTSKVVGGTQPVRRIAGFIMPGRPAFCLPLASSSRSNRCLLVVRGKIVDKGEREGKEKMELNEEDLMELEFGRLLGEPRHETLAKVMKRKTDSDFTYIDFEKSSRRGKDSVRLLKSERTNIQSKLEKQERNADSSWGFSSEKDLHPQLASRPLKPTAIADNGGGEKLPALLQKPSLTSSHEGSFSPYMPAGKTVSRVSMERQRQNSIFDKESFLDEDLLRRPSMVEAKREGNSVLPESGPIVKDVNVDDEGRMANIGNAVDCRDVPELLTAEERFTQLLDREAVNRGAEDELPMLGNMVGGLSSSLTKGPSTSHLDHGKLKLKLSRPKAATDVAKIGDINTDKDLPEIRMPINASGLKSATKQPPAFALLHKSADQAKVKLRLIRPKAADEVAKPADLNTVESPFEFSNASDLMSSPRQSCGSDLSHKDHVVAVTEIESSLKFPEEVESAGALQAGTKAVATSRMEPLVGSSTDLNSSNDTRISELSSSRMPSPIMRKEGPHTVTISLQDEGAKKGINGFQYQPTEIEGGRLNDNQVLLNTNDVLPLSCSSAFDEEEKNTDMVNLLKRPTALQQPAPTTSSSERGSNKSQTCDMQDPPAKMAHQVIVKIPPLEQNQYTKTELGSMKSQIIDMKIHAKENGEQDWVRAEALLKSKETVEVQFTGSNASGLLVSFGGIVGFLTMYELSSRRKLVDFSTWVQQRSDLGKGHQTAQLDDGDNQEAAAGQGFSNGRAVGLATEEERMSLLHVYKQEMSMMLSSFVGEKAKVVVKSVDRRREQLRFSEKEADGATQECAKKKANLMANLKIGDIATCKIKSITPIGAFVELQGVPALIHRSEISWNPMVDPNTFLRVEEEIEAKVCRLDQSLQRISLSLKQMQADPLLETLESLVGKAETSMRSCESERMECEASVRPELEVLITNLKEVQDIINVSMGRRLQSAALTPTFQVFLSAPIGNGYKLLARFGNEIQEVLVETILDRERMKEIIRVSTSKET